MQIFTPRSYNDNVLLLCSHFRDNVNVIRTFVNLKIYVVKCYVTLSQRNESLYRYIIQIRLLIQYHTSAGSYLPASCISKPVMSVKGYYNWELRLHGGNKYSCVLGSFCPLFSFLPALSLSSTEGTSGPFCYKRFCKNQFYKHICNDFLNLAQNSNKLVEKCFLDQWNLGSPGVLEKRKMYCLYILVFCDSEYGRGL